MITRVRNHRVMFVCLGNICRSPTAHGVLQSLLQARDLADSIEVESCGTSNWHIGKPPDTRAVEAAAQRGYDLNTLRGRQIQASDFSDFNYILAMDEENLEVLRAMCPDDYPGHLSLFLDFAQNASAREVPDPYYGGSAGFTSVLDLIEDACNGLIDAIVEQSDPNAHPAQ